LDLLYDQHYAALNPFIGPPTSPPNDEPWERRIVTDQDWLPKSDLMQTEFYNDFMRPQGVHSAMIVPLTVRRPYACALTVNRTEGRGDFTRDELARARRLRPHIRRAFDLADKLAGAGIVSAQASATLDLSPYGLIILNSAGRVLRTNRKADALLASRAAVLLSHGRLSTHDATAARRLEALIALAASHDPELRRGGGMMLRAKASGAPLSVTVTPSRSEALAVFNHGPTVIVCISDLGAKLDISAPELRELLGISAAEARVALALMDGGSAREIAASLGLSFHTVRHHLQALLDQTGARDKADLVALLTRATAGFSR
jgi:DNA-binding CsgD family transcriptional regulator/PAS domain-containing protein